MNWILLGLAILSEVAATASLKASCRLTRPLPTLVVVAGYAVAYYLLSVLVERMHLGTVYAVWCGCGIALIAGLGAWRYGQRLDGWGLAGMGLITAGVLVLALLSDSVTEG